MDPINGMALTVGSVVLDATRLSRNEPFKWRALQEPTIERKHTAQQRHIWIDFSNGSILRQFLSVVRGKRERIARCEREFLESAVRVISIALTSHSGQNLTGQRGPECVNVFRR